MKNGLNKKIFEDKALLQKNQVKYLKKGLLALAAKKIPELPFYYEVGHFEDGSDFITIGEAREIHKIFKQERVKGNGSKDAQGKIQKINKKLVAYGTLCLNDSGQYDFQIDQGFIKKTHLKGSINHVALLKQKIGQNFLITKGGVVATEEDSAIEAEHSAESSPSETTPTEKNIDPEWLAEKAKIKAHLVKLKSNLEKLYAKLS